jgi:hypothetical protein
MNLKGIGISLLAVCGVAATTMALTQDAKTTPASAPKAAAAPADDLMAAMGAKMKEFGTPGASHQILAQRAGKWTYTMKMFMPGIPEPMETKGTSDAKLIMDGRFVQENVTGDFMGEPFHGVYTLGYDNLKKKYVATWMDNMGTAIGYSEGTYDPATKTLTFAGECPDVMAGKYVKSRSVDKMIDNDHGIMQGFQIGADGKEYMSMEMHYTRAK